MFLKTVTRFRNQKGIAGNLFFDDIESDITAKSTFIRKQSHHLDLMVKNYVYILVKINVLRNVEKLIRPFDEGMSEVGSKNP
jgi:hypothetical protein